MVPRGQIRRPIENRLAWQQAKHKENDKRNNENIELHTRDPAGGRRYAGEAEDTGDDEYREKQEHPISAHAFP
jgi:hypothetical protein